MTHVVATMPVSQSPAPQQGFPLPQPQHSASEMDDNALLSAVARGGKPSPPHAEKAEQSGIEYEQAWAGYQQAKRRLDVYAAWHDQLAAIISDGQQAPLVSWPTGKEDAEGNMIVVELDLQAMLDGMEPAMRHQWLVAIYNSACKEFLRWAAAVQKYICTVVKLLNVA